VAAYAVRLSPRATQDLATLSGDVALRIAKKMRILTQDPSPRGDTVKRLLGFTIPTYRLRIGDYRAVFRVGGELVDILRVIHRSELDRALGDLT
jgi:mRNA-degrading endonuclease RelE of RelBE toxin-antitoxin system